MFHILYGQVADSVSYWHEKKKSKDQTFLSLFWARLRDLINVLRLYI